MKGLKDLVDAGSVGVDEEHRAEEHVQKLTDDHNEADRRPAEAQGSGGHGGLSLLPGTDADPCRSPRPCRRFARAVAIIMDGNGRWASARGVGVAEGHRAGSRALRPVVETAIDAGVESLVVYAFSTENWSRSVEEVEALMEIFGEDDRP